MDILIWACFLLLIFAFLAFDLGVFHKNPHSVTFKEASIWTIVWVVLSLIFNVFIYYLYEFDLFGFDKISGDNLTGNDAAIKFFTGYVIEKALSVDNIFVIAVIFKYFQVPNKHQHRILFWGILGALLLRGIMIVIGVSLIKNFIWITYVFGLLLLVSAIKMLQTNEESVNPDKNPFVKYMKKIYPVTTHLDGGKFFIKRQGLKMMTPLFIVLIVIETTDVMFAIDSIPAIFAITTDPFLVFTSNVFAILGLRSMYFVLAAIIDKFRFLQTALVFVLGFVGIKMILVHHYEIPAVTSLIIIISILGGGVLASWLFPGKEEIEPTTANKDEPKG